MTRNDNGDVRSAWRTVVRLFSRLRFGLAAGVWILTFWSGSSPGLVFAEEIAPPPKADAIEKKAAETDSARLLTWFEENMKAGRYAEAAELLGRATEALKKENAPERKQIETTLEWTRLRWLVGRHAEALETAETLWAEGKGSPEAGCLAAQLLEFMGRYAEATTVYEKLLKTDPANLRAQALRGRLARQIGDKQMMKEAADFFFKHYESRFDAFNEGKVDDPKEPAYMGLGIQAENPKDAFEVGFMLAEALTEKAQAQDPEVFLWAAELALEKYAFNEAFKRVQTVLKMRPRLPDALVMQARIVYALRHNYQQAETLLKAALEVNPHHPQALLFRAQLALHEDDDETAQKDVEAALRINPNDLEALAVLAFIHRDRKRFADEEEIEKRALAVNAKPLAYYCTIGELMEAKRGYEDAPRYYRKAAALDPTHWRPMYDLGMNLSRQGKNEEARDLLRRAFQGNRFNVWAVNMLNVLNKILGVPEQDAPARFVELKTENFTLRCPEEELSVIGPYFQLWAEDAYQRITAWFGFEPRGPLTIEMMSVQDQSARTVGLPGLPALGVCFGKLCTVVSPADIKKKGGRNSWRKTLDHEFTHVVTLQMSDYRVPRWLTEGFSTYLEGNTRLDADQMLTDAAARNALKPLLKMNEYFRGSYGLMAYLHGAHVVDYLATIKGAETHKRTLRVLAEGRGLAAALQEATGLTPEQLDVGQQEHVNKFLANVRLRPSLDNADFVRLEQAARGANAPAQSLADLAYAHLAAGKNAAAEALMARALAKDPECADAILLDAELRFRKKDYLGAKKGFASVTTKHPGYSPVGWVRMGEISQKEGRLTAAAEAFQQAHKLYPRMRTPLKPLAALAAVYLEMEPPQEAEALRTWRAAAALDADDLDAAKAGLKLAVKLKNWEAAWELAEACFGVDPFDPETHRWAFAAAEGRKDLPGAAREASVWAALAEKNAEAWLALAKAETALNRQKEALQAVQKALALDPKNESALTLAKELTAP